MLFISGEAGYHLFTCEEASSEVDQLLINTEPVDIVKVSMTPEASSTMRELSGAHFDVVLYTLRIKIGTSSTMREVSGARIDVGLYTLRIKIGTRTTSAHERSHC